MTNPYEVGYPISVPAAEPKVILWFHVYAGLMAAMYFFLSVVVMGLLFFVGEELGDGGEYDFVFFLGLVVFCFFLCFVFLLPVLVPRRPWVWVYSLILICIGLTSICTLPATIPLLIFWLKPEVKQAYAKV